MNLTIISHKPCWRSKVSLTGFATDGGFPLQIEAISHLFSNTTILVPCEGIETSFGLTPLSGRNLTIHLLSRQKGRGLLRKLHLPLWLVINGLKICRAVSRADAVHAPIPGDVGTIAMVIALFLKKPLFVRHCGNWFVQRTMAEKFWRWAMETFAGGRNVMLATGGADEPPSPSNPNIRWIFSSSLREGQLRNIVPRRLSDKGPRLIIACRQEENKGTDVVIASLPLILRSLPDAKLDVVGDGSLVEKLAQQATLLGLADRVTFHGKVAQLKVLDLLMAADIFCYPTSASEGFPKVVLEALASGLPVITTPVSVLPKLMRSGCGIVLDAANPRSLAKAVIDVCSNQRSYNEMSTKALETAREYTIERWRDEIGSALRRGWNVAELSYAEKNLSTGNAS